MKQARWLFAGLVLANLAYFMWVMWVDLPAEHAQPARPSIQPAKMVPLTTPGVALKPRSAGKTESAALTPAQPKAAERCLRIGPFDSRAAAERGAQNLTRMRLAYQLTSEKVNREVGYWVYLPPFPSREAAEAKRRELAQRGVRDIAVVHDGPQVNGVSLGYFAHRDNAERRQQDMSALGLVVKIETREETREEFTLALAPAEIGEATLTALREVRWLSPQVAVTETACPARATP